MTATNIHDGNDGTMAQELTHFIGGKKVKGTSGRFGNVFWPMTGEVAARVPLASTAQVDVAVQNALTEAADDATFKPGITILGLAEDGVGYAVDENNEALITAEMTAAAEDYKAKIIAGEISVHDYTADSTCPL